MGTGGAPEADEGTRRLAAVLALPGGELAADLAFGEHPREAALRAGAADAVGPGRVLDVRSGVAAGTHSLEVVYEAVPAPLAVLPAAPWGRGPRPGRPGTPVEVPDGTPRVQRPGAYGVCLDDDRILLTRLRHTDLWTLPGGGVDHGEDVRSAVVREVHEETGLPFAVGALLDVDSVHFVGHAPDGRLEDFHGVRVLFAGSVPTDVAPQVTEVDGSTAEAAWVPLDGTSRLRLAGLVKVALGLVR